MTKLNKYDIMNSIWMGETIQTNVRFRTCLTHVRGIKYVLNRKYREIFSMIGGKGKKRQLSVGWC